MHQASPTPAAIDALLPQTQCTRCGYRDCAAYAAAIAHDGAPIDRCPPGGEPTLDRLAALTGRPRGALDPSCGAPGPLAVAIIDEAECIGCTLCIAACPVDAILGGPKRMHVVVAALCSGCELCVAPCPVDCIDLVPAGREWTRADAFAARERHRARDARIARGERIADRGRAEPARGTDPAARRRAAVDAALERARARRGGARDER